MVGKNSERFSLEGKIGAVPIRVEAGERPLIWLRTPAIRHEKTYERALCAQVLGLDAKELLEITPQYVSAGNSTILIGVRDRAAVDRAWLDLAGLRALEGGDAEPMCAFVFCTDRGWSVLPDVCAGVRNDKRFRLGAYPFGNKRSVTSA